MPKISKAARAELFLQLSIVNGQWQHISKFLSDEHEALDPIYQRWLAQQDHEVES
jgi:hypothetical protein